MPHASLWILAGSPVLDRGCVKVVVVESPKPAAAASWATSAAVRRNMQANRGRDTQPELAVRRALHAAGMRYRVNFRPDFMRRRTIDIAFTRWQVACFIDGCFWHGCPEHFVEPRSNPDYWLPKIERNRQRDGETREILSRHGWSPLRFWEHEDPERVVAVIIDSLARAGYARVLT
jgi:DNA mismatch endonuclease, patch repair protein